MEVAVVAVAKSTSASHLFRSYGARSKAERCSVVQACLATSAATTFFPSVTINGVQYVDGAFRANNPSYTALAELESIEAPLRLPDAVAGVGCFVSLGTGRATFSYEKMSKLSALRLRGLVSLKSAAKMCAAITMDCHKEHEKVAYRYTQTWNLVQPSKH